MTGKARKEGTPLAETAAKDTKHFESKAVYETAESKQQTKIAAERREAAKAEKAVEKNGSSGKKDSQVS
ncbi:hypothetical protein SLS61_004936 [Didymella pomorum]